MGSRSLDQLARSLKRARTELEEDEVRGQIPRAKGMGGPENRVSNHQFGEENLTVVELLNDHPAPRVLRISRINAVLPSNWFLRYCN